jgi:multiple sugar transport system permease protein
MSRGHFRQCGFLESRKDRTLSRITSSGTMLFLFPWEAFLWPLISTRSEQLRVIQVALAGFEQRYATLWNELFAASNVATLIPLLILLPLQRFYIQGVTASGFKG